MVPSVTASENKPEDHQSAEHEEAEVRDLIANREHPRDQAVYAELDQGLIIVRIPSTEPR